MTPDPDPALAAPAEIYADMDLRHQSQGMWECVPFTIHPDSPRYIRADIAEAAVQAAVAKAVEASAAAGVQAVADYWADEGKPIDQRRQAGRGLAQFVQDEIRARKGDAS